MTRFEAIQALIQRLREIDRDQHHLALRCVLSAAGRGKRPDEMLEAVERAGFATAPRLSAEHDFGQQRQPVLRPITEDCPAVVLHNAHTESEALPELVEA